MSIVGGIAFLHQTMPNILRTIHSQVISKVKIAKASGASHRGRLVSTGITFAADWINCGSLLPASARSTVWPKVSADRRVRNVRSSWGCDNSSRGTATETGTSIASTPPAIGGSLPLEHPAQPAGDAPELRAGRAARREERPGG